MWATIRMSPLASSTAIAVRSPPDLEKSTLSRGSMGGASLPLRQSRRQTLQELAQVLEAGTLREARLRPLAAATGELGAFQDPEAQQQIGGVREGDGVRGLAPLGFAEEHRARELLRRSALELLAALRPSRSREQSREGRAVGLEHGARLLGEEAQRREPRLAGSQLSVASQHPARALEVVEEGVEVRGHHLPSRREELGVEEVEPARELGAQGRGIAPAQDGAGQEARH